MEKFVSKVGECMLSYEEIYNEVKNRLSEKRFYHSECVVERCIEYAKIYGIDVEKAKIAGILHDVAKEIPKEEQIELAEKYEIKLDEIEKMQGSLLHAKVGAEIAKRDFNCTEDIYNAIKCHTTGKENMTILEKVLFMADATGKDRTWGDTEILYNLSKTDIDKAITILMKECIIDVINQDKLVHPDSIHALNYMLLKRDK